MDVSPKTGDGGVRGIKRKGSFPRTIPPQKLARNTLQQWLVKPLVSTIKAEASPTQDNKDRADTCPPPSTQSPDSRKPDLSDSNSGTQPLTPQDLPHNSPELKAFEDNQKKESTIPEGFRKPKTKITDFFSEMSPLGLPIRLRKATEIFERGNADKPLASAVGKPAVKWLGTPINKLKRVSGCSQLPVLKDDPSHTVMIRVCEILSITKYILIPKKNN